MGSPCNRPRLLLRACEPQAQVGTSAGNDSLRFVAGRESLASATRAACCEKSAQSKQRQRTWFGRHGNHAGPGEILIRLESRRAGTAAVGSGKLRDAAEF